MAAIINGFGLRGINGYLVTIEVDTVYGKPMVSIVGIAIGLLIQSKQINIEEASSVKGVNIFAFNNLNEVIQFLQGVNPYKKIELAKNRIIKNEFIVDFSEVRGQDSTLEFIVAAAAGRHNILLAGEISLAHNGVLFLDEIAEFSKQSLEGLRAPLEDGKVMISRVRSTGEFPANFMLVGAMNPCPCGYSGGSKCKCKDSDIIRYRGRLSGPIMDRIDIQRFLNPVKIEDLRGEVKGVESKVLKERVMKAREIQEKRFKEFNGINDNSKKR